MRGPHPPHLRSAARAVPRAKIVAVVLSTLDPSKVAPTDAERLARFEKAMTWPIFFSAILPILFAADLGRSWVGDAVMIVAWGVFILDLVVHIKLKPRYLRSGWGRFDLVVVVLTAPWFLLPGWGNARFVSLARLARLVRVVKAASGSIGRLAQNVGKVGLITVVLIFTCGLVAYNAEHPTNTEFATFGDSIWWATVTITTVGYGDVVPITPTGRFIGTVLMFAGLGVLGVLSGSLASFFGFGAGSDEDDERVTSAPVPASGSDGDVETDPGSIAVQLAGLRAQVAALDQAIAALEAQQSR